MRVRVRVCGSFEGVALTPGRTGRRLLCSGLIEHLGAPLESRVSLGGRPLGIGADAALAEAAGEDVKMSWNGVSNLGVEPRRAISFAAAVLNFM